MAQQRFKNNASSLLSGSILVGATTLAVTAASGAEFPSTAGGDSFLFSIENAAGLIEICKCTARSGDTFTTIVRGQEGTTARAWTAGDRVEQRVTAGFLDKVIVNDGTVPMTGALAMGGQAITGAGAIAATSLTASGNVVSSGAAVSAATSVGAGTTVNAGTSVVVGTTLILPNAASIIFAGGEEILTAAVNGATQIKYDNASRLITETDGVRVVGGASQTLEQAYDLANTTRRGYINWNAAGGQLDIVSEMHGATVALVGEDAGGTLRAIVNGDPDAAANLYYAGSAKLSTAAAGVAVTGILDATTLSQGGVGVSLNTHSHSGLVTAAGATQAFSTVGNFAHGLGQVPYWFTVNLICTTAENGYAINDEIPYNAIDYPSSEIPPTIGANATHVFWTMRSTSTITYWAKGASTEVNLNVANWGVVARAFKIS